MRSNWAGPTARHVRCRCARGACRVFRSFGNCLLLQVYALLTRAPHPSLHRLYNELPMTLHIEALCKSYGDKPVFRDVSLSVGAGEFVAVMGDSGVGKSTLLNCMAGLDSWDGGRVLLQGQYLGQLSDTALAAVRRQHIGFVFQAFHVLPHLDVAQNVGLPLLLLGTPDKQRVQTMLDAVGLGDMGARLPQTLSGGQLQRVAIARALYTARPCYWPMSLPATWTQTPPPWSWTP